MSVQAAEARPIHVSRNAPLRMSVDRRGESGYETMPKAERPPHIVANIERYTRLIDLGIRLFEPTPTGELPPGKKWTD